MPLLSLEMRPELSEVDMVVTSLKEAAGKALSEMKLATFEIALSEALTNAVRHGLASSEGSMAPDQPIKVTLSDSPRGLLIEIIDAGTQGPEDLYEDVASPDAIDLMAESGRGLSLIRHCVDDLTFEPAPGHNRLELLFHPDLET